MSKRKINKTRQAKALPNKEPKPRTIVTLIIITDGNTYAWPCTDHDTAKAALWWYVVDNWESDKPVPESPDDAIYDYFEDMAGVESYEIDSPDTVTGHKEAVSLRRRARAAIRRINQQAASKAEPREDTQ